MTTTEWIISEHPCERCGSPVVHQPGTTPNTLCLLCQIADLDQEMGLQ